jgi:hypothetical protein
VTKNSRSAWIFCGWVLLAENILRLRPGFAANYNLLLFIICALQKKNEYEFINSKKKHNLISMSK